MMLGNASKKSYSDEAGKRERARKGGKGKERVGGKGVRGKEGRERGIEGVKKVSSEPAR